MIGWSSQGRNVKHMDTNLFRYMLYQPKNGKVKKKVMKRQNWSKEESATWRSALKMCFISGAPIKCKKYRMVAQKNSE